MPHATNLALEQNSQLKKLSGQCRHGFVASVCETCEELGPDRGTCTNSLCLTCTEACSGIAAAKIEQKRILDLNESPHDCNVYGDDCVDKYDRICKICPYTKCLDRIYSAKMSGLANSETCDKYEGCDVCPLDDVCRGRA